MEEEGKEEKEEEEGSIIALVDRNFFAEFKSNYCIETFEFNKF